MLPSAAELQSLASAFTRSQSSGMGRQPALSKCVFGTIPARKATALSMRLSHRELRHWRKILRRTDGALQMDDPDTIEPANLNVLAR